MHAKRHYDDPELLVHVDDFARATNITAQRLRQMSREGYFDRPEDGYWDLYVVLPEIVKYLRATGQVDRQRMAKAKADMAEIKAHAMKGQVAPVDVTMRQWTVMVTRFKQKMINVPVRAAPILATETDPAVITEVLTRLIEEAAQELSETKTRVVREDEDGLDRPMPVIARIDAPPHPEAESEDYLGDPEQGDSDDDEEDEDSNDADGFSSEFEEGFDSGFAGDAPAAKAHR